MRIPSNWQHFALGAVVAFLLATAFSATARTGHPYFRRYEIRANQTHAFVLDTITGQVWERRVGAEPDRKAGSFFRPKYR